MELEKNWVGGWKDSPWEVAGITVTFPMVGEYNQNNGQSY